MQTSFGLGKPGVSTGFKTPTFRKSQAFGKLRVSVKVDTCGSRTGCKTLGAPLKEARNHPSYDVWGFSLPLPTSGFPQRGLKRLPNRPRRENFTAAIAATYGAHWGENKNSNNHLREGGERPQITVYGRRAGGVFFCFLHYHFFFFFSLLFFFVERERQLAADQSRDVLESRTAPSKRTQPAREHRPPIISQ